jgi:hypothetical protein
MNAMAAKLARPFEINSPSSFANSGGGGDCPPDTSLQSRQYVSPLVAFVTVQHTNNAAIGDVPLILPIPARVIVCVSTLLAEQGNTLFLHFVPLSKNYSATIAIQPTGTENWLPMCGLNTAGGTGRMGSGWVFTKPLPPTQNLYLDIGQESGGASGPITFMVSNDVDYWKLTGTQGN